MVRRSRPEVQDQSREAEGPGGRAEGWSADRTKSVSARHRFQHRSPGADQGSAAMIGTVGANAQRRTADVLLFICLMKHLCNILK